VTATKFARVYLDIERDYSGLAEIGFPNGGGGKKLYYNNKLKRKTTGFPSSFSPIFVS